MRDKPCKPIRLTTEEALGLLDIVMLSPSELTEAQHSALLKLGRFCRDSFGARGRLSCAEGACQCPVTGADNGKRDSTDPD